MSDNISHKELVDKGALFLTQIKNWKFRCQYAVTEFKCSGVQEQPDILGFDSCKQILIEVKVSRMDFKRDFKKVCRQLDGCSDLGTFRYYLAPKGIIKVDELPDNWGLLEFDNEIKVIKESGTFIPNQQATTNLYYSIIRRTNKQQILTF